MTDQIDIIKKSVTSGDYAESPRAGIFNFLVPLGLNSTGGLPPELPAYWSQSRDRVLRSTILHEDFWGGAIAIAITKMSSLAWEVDSEIPLRSKRLQEILLNTNWVKFIGMHLRDFLTTDNGSFVEVVRATSSPVSKVMGIIHLDSARCTRTGDPEIPLIYTDRRSREHEMQAHQVFMLSDMPDPSELLFGVGLCAASRAYKSIYKLAVIDRYVGEKVSGRRPLAIHFVSSVGPKQLESIRIAAEEDAARQGILSYMGAIVVPLMDASTAPQVATVPLAELPDRFNRKEEFDIGLLAYANSIGLDPQDLQPLTGQAIGTGAQSAVLDEKAKGKGLASWRQEFIHNVNEYLADELTTFMFIENDYRDKERRAGIGKMTADTSAVRIGAGITTAAQELQVLVDEDQLPKEFLPEDVTGDTLSDTEKPEKEAAEAGDEVGEVEEINADMEAEQPEPVIPEVKSIHNMVVSSTGKGVRYSCTDCHNVFDDFEGWKAHVKEFPPDDDLQAEIEEAREESKKLYRQARKKEPRE